MKKDTYTKVILTIIAITLIILVLKEVDLISTAYAGDRPSQPSQSYGLIPINPDGSITVKFKPDEVLDVQIRGIDEAPDLRWEAIKVKLQQ